MPYMSHLDLWLAIGCVALAGLGCAQVDPAQDYQRTAQLVHEQLGVEQVYDPESESLIAEKVDGLLAGGVTVDEAVCIALLNNRSFQAHVHEIAMSRADIVQSGLLTNPSMSLLLQFPEGGGRSKLEYGFGQELVDLWQIPVRKRIAEGQLDQTILSVVKHGIDLGTDVRVKCYRLLALQRIQTVAHENLDLVRESMRIAQQRYDAGEVSVLDVRLAEAKVLEVQLEELTLQRDARIASAELAHALSLSRSNRPWVLQDDLPRLAPLPEQDTALLLWAMQQRVDAQISASRVLTADDELKRQYLNIVPSVTSGLLFERSEDRAAPGRKVLADTARSSIADGALTAPGIQSRAERRADQRQVIDALLGPNLQITLPIWDQNQAQIAKARYEMERRRREYEDLLDTVADEVQRAFETARAAAEQVHFYDERALPIARENLDTARRLYGQGDQNIFVLIEAQQSLIQQQRAYVDVLRDYAVAIAELQQAVGGRLPDAAATQPQ